MNSIDFLKKGSTINIKKKNRGKFTSYCGGNVTSECISRGKHSSNPAIRKRAVFAENARKWKHKNGGAFVEGVNVLDSNPSMYKYIKKKIKMHADGAKFDWGGLASQAVEAIPGIIQSIAQNSSLKKQKDRIKALTKLQNQQDRMYASQQANQYIDQLRQQQQEAFNSGESNEQWSDIVGGYTKNKIAEQLAQQKLADNQMQANNLNAQLDKQINDNYSSMINSFGSILNKGIGMFSDYMQNKTKPAEDNKNAAPSSTTSNSSTIFDFQATPKFNFSKFDFQATPKFNFNKGIFGDYTPKFNFMMANSPQQQNSFNNFMKNWNNSGDLFGKAK